MKKVEDYVRSIPDFPEKGIIFRDITTVIQSPEGLKLAIDGINEKLKGVDYDVVVGPESTSAAAIATLNFVLISISISKQFSYILLH